MIQGRPGCGKTILANQICFHHAARGGRVLYVTLLAETHERLMEYIQQLDFFDLASIPERLSYVSGFATLQEGGLKALAELLRREARARSATLLIIDGLVSVRERAETDNEFKKFIQELQIHANLLRHTVVLLTTAETDSLRPEHTMADGVLAVADNRYDRRAERELEVKKLRGSDYLRGSHAFQIDRRGVTIYPRLEALLANPSHHDSCKLERVSTGVPSLDKQLHGGLRCASSTVLFGPTGAGKTSLGLHFLSAVSRQEPGMLFGFYETPPRLLMKAKTLGIDFGPRLADGSLVIQWSPSTERILDALGDQLLSAVKERGIKRLFVDGVDGFVQAAAYPERITHFLSALTNELRVRGVTTLYTSELNHLFSNELALPLQGISSLVENILLIRFVELGGRLVRVCSVVKTRDSAYEESLRELLFSPGGVELGKRVDGSFGVQHNAAKSGAPGGPLHAVRRLLRARSRQP